jgi:exodeoxyribonuclease VII large subunit
MVTRVATDRSPPDDVQSVSDLTSRVKEQLETRFADVWVTGEVSNLTRASSGHVYLSLKDEEAVLRAVIWRGTMQALAIEPTDGLAVICHGRLEVYPPRGTYQLTIDRLHAVGTGTLEARLRRVHALLDAEGVFAPARKRPLPEFPARIAVVTSPTGAAIADFLETLLSRWRGTEVILVPSRVQGAGAAEELAAALAAVARLRPAVDAIALIRGGGSLEDLWSFNEEVLVRAVAASPIPVVSGVGHEIDVSLCDLAADVRALTPTDAAVKLVPDARQVTAAVAGLGARMQTSLARRLEFSRDRLTMLARSRMFVDPSRRGTTRSRQPRATAGPWLVGDPARGSRRRPQEHRRHHGRRYDRHATYRRTPLEPRGKDDRRCHRTLSPQTRPSPPRLKPRSPTLARSCRGSNQAASA